MAHACIAHARPRRVRVLGLRASYSLAIAKLAGQMTESLRSKATDHPDAHRWDTLSLRDPSLQGRRARFLPVDSNVGQAS